MVSRFRCPVDIIGMTTDKKVWRKLALSWGVKPMLSYDEKIQKEHAQRTCSRASLQQAQAIGYAIAVLRRIPAEPK